MKKRIVSLVMAIAMCLSLSVTTFATEATTESTDVFNSTTDENGFFEIVVPRERIDADGYFEATIQMTLSSNRIRATANHISVDISSELISLDDSMDPEDSPYNGLTYTIGFRSAFSTSNAASTTLTVGNDYLLNMYGVSAGTTYTMRLTINDADYPVEMQHTPYAIRIIGYLNNVEVV